MGAMVFIDQEGSMHCVEKHTLATVPIIFFSCVFIAQLNSFFLAHTSRHFFTVFTSG